MKTVPVPVSVLFALAGISRRQTHAQKVTAAAKLLRAQRGK